ncbi:protoporphyrinogen oxidase-like [Dreissena polymorpha]|uniref:Protoporphyrinogen oxidase n=1 Tax=Dreissena polymorpha TaxID=45954 RepID=A0A9D4FBR2_DREPO|nr:protoporphyrinogen oxidase-like [Dreissena polymorpha]KAH3794896.1 hypothetical protein DPMN_148435 [Dreissena polymorpha]
MPTAVVIGGGISGLSSAYYLKKSAKFSKIIILEASNRVGGWIKTVTSEGGAKMELGPRSLRATGIPAGFNSLCLIEDLGLSKDVIHVSRHEPAAQNRFIYAKGALHKLPNKFSAFFKKQAPFSAPLFLHSFRDILTKPSELEDESVYDFVTRRFHAELAEFAVDPLCRGIFAGDCRKLSLHSCFPLLREAEKVGGGPVIKGLLKISRRPIPPRRQSTLFDTMRKETWSAFSFRQGLQTLPETLRDSLTSSQGVELVLDTPCSEVMFDDGKAKIVINGETLDADHVVSSIFAPDFASLLNQEQQNLKENLSKISAVNAVVVCVEFDGQVVPPTPGFGHLLPSSEDKAVLGVIYDSCTFPTHDRTDRPGSRYTIMLGGAWFDDLKAVVPSMTDGALGQYAVKALQKHLGFTQTPTKIKVEVMKNCIPQYFIGHENILEDVFAEIRAERLPLSLVGSSYRGPSIHDCMNNARVEIERVTGASLL